MVRRRSFVGAVLGALLALLPIQPARADQAAIRKALEPRLGKIDRISPSPVPGVWEIVTGPRVQYSDAAGSYLFDGPLKDARSGKDLTAERQFALLPLELALSQARGTGRNVLVTFEDPNCVYCKRLAQELTKVPDLRVYTFLYPILGADSMEKATNIWCAPDRVAAWNAQMLKDTAAPKAKAGCDTAGLQKSIDTARKLGLRGTPNMFLAGGEHVRGFVTAAQLEQRFRARNEFDARK